MKSEVELNKGLIRVSDTLYYIDSENNEKFIVLSVDEIGFKAIDSEDNIDMFIFSELQTGWHISDRTKITHEILDKFIYR